ncbi:hypothetical protein LTR84_013133 [Exophiala bonariae]|uniref:Uncharacterized protein n=1 Tax=Exophiala bonariae TaxID=1690606 RepID=A0AAV9NE54_9EURO|nr:hypothetical protein LTR84_013133 [Exophiala bonariae]
MDQRSIKVPADTGGKGSPHNSQDHPEQENVDLMTGNTNTYNGAKNFRAAHNFLDGCCPSTLSGGNPRQLGNRSVSEQAGQQGNRNDQTGATGHETNSASTERTNDDGRRNDGQTSAWTSRGNQHMESQQEGSHVNVNSLVGRLTDRPQARHNDDRGHNLSRPKRATG